MNPTSDFHRQAAQDTNTPSSIAQTAKVDMDLHLNGAALIDEQGQEIPITEAMINSALKSLQIYESASTTRTSNS